MPLPVILVNLLKAAGLLGAELALDRALSSSGEKKPTGQMPPLVGQGEEQELPLAVVQPAIERDEYDDALELLREPMFTNKPDLILEVRNR